ncbi:hypothetical protein [Rothia kristinae]|uniref:hypothetical protein n=1 Tax=Rothia kristinae TaxID=37923 RepID=UPI001E453A29|nr:hypothetical protein [Rothia kristinae]MCT1357506.1 hypothetical protein [Rothia kristinae]MCT1392306.1 hypothetical protein [Rothia kristinae]MCT1505402.1 hypothetical protein [Rothia kristinae]MCT2038833.1 hypothetical protein [Rothia kristinae]MCT2243048.1 hypothetical protein [Rothia kristinae]
MRSVMKVECSAEECRSAVERRRRAEKVSSCAASVRERWAVVTDIGASGHSVG